MHSKNTNEKEEIKIVKNLLTISECILDIKL